MTLRIEKSSDGETTTIRLAGEMQAEHIPEVNEMLNNAGPRVVLDLNELMLVDRNAVRFLCTCEPAGIELRNGSRYIREWISREAAIERVTKPA